MAATSRSAQTAEVLQRLRQTSGARPGLTPKDALDFGCYRLAARIFDLRQAGHDIATLWEGDGDRRYARYVLLHSASGRGSSGVI